MEEEKKKLEEQHSVKMSVNAKGNFSAEVKCYGLTPEEALSRCTEITASVETIIKERNGL